MSKQAFRLQLYEAFSADLKSIDEQLFKDYYLCPICWRAFSRTDLDNGNLTDGHVWPNFLREIGSGTASQQRVLLCKSCNSTSGTRGDAHIQNFEEAKAADKDEQHYGMQNVQIIAGPNRAITIRGYIHKHDNSLKLNFSPKNNDPHQIEVFKSWFERNERVSVIAQNDKPCPTEFAQVGLVTAAYLYSFLSLGYRYILHNTLRPVRRYILDSFITERGEEFPLPDIESFGTFECGKYQETPQIGIVVPLDGKTRPYLMIDYLDHSVHLPFHYNPELLDALIHHTLPKLLHEQDINEQTKLYSPISCNKLSHINCIWSEIMGTPVYLDSTNIHHFHNIS